MVTGGVGGFRLRRAARHLRAGGIVAYPTEAVYGLGCLPDDRDAFERLLVLKGREVAKGVILVAAEADMFDDWLAPLAAEVRERMRASWPGPVTWVAPAAPWVPWWLGGGRGTLAVRVPGHATARALSAAVGAPVVSTSANRSGGRPARSALGVRLRLDGADLLVLHGPTGGLARPSTVRDALTGAVLRS